MALLVISLTLWLVLCLATIILPRPTLRAFGGLLRRLGIVPTERPMRRVGWLGTLMTMAAGLCLAVTGLVGSLVVAMFVVWDFHEGTPSDRKALQVSHFTPNVPGVAFQPLDEPLRERIVAEVRPLVDTAKHVGIVVGIIRGSQAAVLGFGERELGRTNVPDGNTVFEIGSISKVFTATAFSRLVAEGKVPLECPLQELLPENVKVPEFQSKRMTLLDLATQTSGLPRLADNMNSAWSMITLRFLKNPYSAYTPEDAYAFLSRHQLTQMPGSHYEYSNFGMGLLGLALSRHQGTSYEGLISDQVCAPLGMQDTRLNLTPSMRGRLARGYTVLIPEGSTIIGFGCGPWEFGDATAGAGGLRSTGNDMLKFLAANLEIMEKPLGKALEQAHEKRREADLGMSIGLGWHMLNDLTPVDGPVIWHNGQTGGYYSFIGFGKSQKIGVVMLSNTGAELDGKALEILKLLASPESKARQRL